MVRISLFRRVVASALAMLVLVSVAVSQEPGDEVDGGEDTIVLELSEPDDDIAKMIEEAHRDSVRVSVTNVRRKTEAESLAVDTELLRAKAENCDARRVALEAGVDTKLCEGDRLTRAVAVADGGGVEETGGSSGVVSFDTASLQRIETLEATLSVLRSDLNGVLAEIQMDREERQEEEYVETPAPVVVVETQGSAISGDYVLLVSGPARAIVGERQGSRKFPVRIPFEGNMDERGCVVVKRDIFDGPVSGALICP